MGEVSARTQLRDHFATALPAYRVTGSKGVMDGPITRPTIGVWQQSFTRRPDWQLDHVQVGLEVWVVVPQEDPDKADDALDDGLEDVLGALRTLDWVDWVECQRGILNDTAHGYNITVNAVAKIGD